MQIDADKLFEDAIRSGIMAGVKDKLSGYQSPLDPVLKAAIEKHVPAFRTLLEDAVGSCVDDPLFRQNIAETVRAALAKMLIQRFGGELEKQINVLKSDPTTRARIVLAIEEIVKSQLK